MRIFATIISYLLALPAVAIIAAILVLGLAGPHAGLLPSWLEPAILGLGWLTVLIAPLLVARAVWRRLGRREREP